MILRLNMTPDRLAAPDYTSLANESDVEQKFLYPALVHPSFLALNPAWIRTKDYMAPTEIDKGSGKKRGYVPDYSVWVSGFPIVIIEAKDPSVAIEVGLSEGHLYASQINKRYPPKVNPIAFVVSCNGVQIALASSDSEADTLIIPVEDFVPGSAGLETYRQIIGRASVEQQAEQVATHFKHRPFYRVSSSMGGQRVLSQQLGVNEFAQHLFPVIVKYFGNEDDEARDEIVDKAYVATSDVTDYGKVLETYLKDRVRVPGANLLKPIITGRHNEQGLTSEISKFTANPSFYGRVQLIIGAVGSGKSTFIRRFYRRLLPKEVAEKTYWSFLDFNVRPPHLNLIDYVSSQFVTSLAKMNDLVIGDLAAAEKIFAPELRQFERGPAKLLKTADPAEYAKRKVEALDAWMNDKAKLAECVARHYSGERHKGIVVVFDNVDRRSRDEQLEIFEAAQWLSNLTHALSLINLRDTTFEAHRDEPPLDAFINAINFYIKPPRFSRVVRSRLDLVLSKIVDEVDKVQHYTLSSGIRITYPSSRLGEFLVGIYISVFGPRTMQTAGAIEALSGRNVRRALGLFADIIVSPHIPTSKLTGAALTEGSVPIDEETILRALMKGRYKYFNGSSVYVRNVVTGVEGSRPSNFLYADILEFLIRNRKRRIDFSIEGYALVSTVIERMEQLGYDSSDCLISVRSLVDWGLIEPESLITKDIDTDDAVMVHASGFIHMRYFVFQPQYMVGITPDLMVASHGFASLVGAIWASQLHEDIGLASKAKIAESLYTYLNAEYERRCRRHPFYAELGFGGRVLVGGAEKARNVFAKRIEELQSRRSTSRRRT